MRAAECTRLGGPERPCSPSTHSTAASLRPAAIFPFQELLERYSRLRLAVEMANDKQVGCRTCMALGGAGLAVERMAAMLKVALGLLSATPTRVYTHHGHADVALTS